jgi:membrane associated rhomboid family serine protease
MPPTDDDIGFESVLPKEDAMGMRVTAIKGVFLRWAAFGFCGGPQRLWMAVALLLPLLFGDRRPALASLVWPGMAALWGVAGCAVLWTAACQKRRDRCEAIPPGKGAKPADRGYRKRLPVATLTFIVVCILLTFVLPDAATDHLCGLHFDDPGLADLIRVVAARSFLHDTYGRLFVNAVLLGLLGGYLEPGLGGRRTLMVLFMGSFVAGLLSLNLVLPQGATSEVGPYLLRYPPAGGTGAAAALLGFGARGGNPVRDAEGGYPGVEPLFCRAMDFFWPLLTALVFWGPFSGHTMPITGPSGMAGYWGQAGAFSSGLTMALIWRTLDENDLVGPCRRGPRTQEREETPGCVAERGWQPT